MVANRASIFLIGTEITRGVIADAHGRLLARELSAIGYDVRRIVIVPDDGSIEEMLHLALRDSEILLLTGGLGPTSDDVTREIVAKLAGVKIVRDELSYNALFERIGERLLGINERQVTLPEGFRAIKNTNGSAIGFVGLLGERSLCYAMPGVPSEMHAMFYHQVLPELVKKIGFNERALLEFSCFLTPESKLEEVCKASACEGIEWGTRVQEHRISLYLHGGSAEGRQSMVEGIEAKLGRGRLWRGDIDLSLLLGDFLLENSLTMGCAESCTGGLVSKLMSDRNGSSAYFWGGVVSYANAAKEGLLKVKGETLEKWGAVSDETVIEMAEGLRELSKVDFTLAVSGVAGDGGGSVEKPVGTIYLGFASKKAPSEAVRLNFTSFGRDSVRRRSAQAALLLGYFYLKGEQLLDIVESWQYI
ncbi:MAG: nicotinamide-nucleotide amidohydrolase family protein [Sphaerochaetaceae bacterium]|nr:nicotinamide-nucleotide amidohydrolase family protein [Sphaerochaetaceae bacterium]HHU89275.1 nicotinamide-nucleotide amidohydrolase family protein [Spirochaetales bacterium]